MASAIDNIRHHDGVVGSDFPNPIQERIILGSDFFLLVMPEMYNASLSKLIVEPNIGPF